MSDIVRIGGVDADSIKKQALEEVNKEMTDKAVKVLKQKYRDLENAKKVVANIQREIDDTLASINDGSFVA